MPTVINGLPAHVLLIHVIVVLAPVGALLIVLSAVWPRARARIGVVSPLTALVVLVLTPVTTNAGEWLQDKLEKQGKIPAIEKHANLGHTFLWFAIGLFVVATGVWLLGRRFEFGLVGLPDAGSAATEPSNGGGGTATLTRSETTTRQLLPTMASVAIAVVAVAMGAVTVWQLYRIGDSGAHAAWGYVQQLK